MGLTSFAAECLGVSVRADTIGICDDWGRFRLAFEADKQRARNARTRSDGRRQRREDKGCQDRNAHRVWEERRELRVLDVGREEQVAQCWCLQAARHTLYTRASRAVHALTKPSGGASWHLRPVVRWRNTIRFRHRRAAEERASVRVAGQDSES